MSTDLIVHDTTPRACYVIRYDAVAESKITPIKYADSNMVINELVKYFSDATQLLRHKRRELFSE